MEDCVSKPCGSKVSFQNAKMAFHMHTVSQRFLERDTFVSDLQERVACNILSRVASMQE